MSTNKNIKRFQIIVTVKDSSEWSKAYDKYVTILRDQMRETGYVPVLDLFEHVSVDYTGKAFNYTLTGHGIYLGRKRSWKVEGLAGDKLLTRTPTNK